MRECSRRCCPPIHTRCVRPPARSRRAHSRPRPLHSYPDPNVRWRRSGSANCRPYPHNRPAPAFQSARAQAWRAYRSGWKYTGGTARQAGRPHHRPAHPDSSCSAPCPRPYRTAGTAACRRQWTGLRTDRIHPAHAARRRPAGRRRAHTANSCPHSPRPLPRWPAAAGQRLPPSRKWRTKRVAARPKPARQRAAGTGSAGCLTAARLPGGERKQKSDGS